MATETVFDDPNIVSSYEDWYRSTGKKAARQEKQLLRSIFDDFEGSQTILDVGCGTGYFTNWYRTLDFEPFGLDRSSQMIKQARKNYRLNCCLGDAARLPFPSNSFDLVSLIAVLAFIPDPIPVLREAFRVARQGMILGVINRHSLVGWRYQRSGGPIWKDAKLYTTRELKSMLLAILERPCIIKLRTTLWPIFSGSSKLPWGGFIGLWAILK